jgi:hypothetical protein
MGGCIGPGCELHRLDRFAAVIAHEKVLDRMSTPSGNQAARATDAWPTDTYHRQFYKLTSYFNGEPVVVYHEPNAHTDGDSIVYFRHSEVIAAGEVFSTVSYPLIDIEKGGSIQGIIDGLNNILDLAVAEYRSQGGTWIVPGHGRLSDVADVASYRNMVVMIRDRIQDMMKSGRTLEQIKAAKPSLDFDGRYGSTTGAWTTSMFIEASIAAQSSWRMMKLEFSFPHRRNISVWHAPRISFCSVLLQKNSRRSYNSYPTAFVC